MALCKTKRRCPKHVLDKIQNGAIYPSFIVTHRMKLENVPRACEIFNDNRVGSSSSPWARFTRQSLMPGFGLILVAFEGWDAGEEGSTMQGGFFISKGEELPIALKVGQFTCKRSAETGHHVS